MRKSIGCYDMGHGLVKKRKIIDDSYVFAYGIKDM